VNSADAQKFLHDLRNALNTLSINAALIRRLHKNAVEPEILDRMDTALRESEHLMTQFQDKLIDSEQ